MDLRTFAKAQKQWVPPSCVLAAMRTASVCRDGPLPLLGPATRPCRWAFSSLALDVVGITSAILVDYCLLNVLSGSWQVGEACG